MKQCLTLYFIFQTVVKTRAQTDPGIVNHANGLVVDSGNNASIGMIRSSLNIIEREGIEALLLGAQATILGYFWYGLSVYPTYTFAKRFMSQEIITTSYSILHANEIALLAGACAAVVASLGLAPIEAARIRVVADPSTYRPLGVTGTLNVIATENPSLGWKNLYASLPSLLTRQVIFGSTKFLVFERACDYMYRAHPELHETTLTCLVVTLIAGGFSGIVSSIVSQPADSVLTYIAKQKSTSNDEMNIIDVLRKMNSEGGMRSLFRGLRSRCLWAGSITWLGVRSVDLMQRYQLVLPDLGSIASNS
jgi:solute carrier family 25 (mitochondrial phosphate transporter), member 3